ncbi:MAG: hypothetical protein GY898_18605 [Proteobacteria bacterium]|nr:hypothetical protein [Pseudomonadota bacterium]
MQAHDTPLRRPILAMVMASLSMVVGVWLMNWWSPAPEPELETEIATPEGGMAEILDATEKPARALVEEQAEPTGDAEPM